jgi:signal transduction histidine kinase
MDANLSIFKKGLVLVSIPLLSQLLYLGILAAVRANQAEAQQWALHTQAVIAQAETAYRWAVEAHSQIRGFVVHPDPTLLPLFHDASANGKNSLATLRQLVRDNPDQEARAVALQQLATSLLNWLQETLDLAQRGQRSELAPRLHSQEGRQQLNALRARIDAFIAEEERLYRERRASLEYITWLQNWVLVGGAFLALATTGLTLWTFSRGISGRLGVLTENARRLAAGQELASRLGGRDEIGRLDGAFHDMAEALVQKNRENEMFVSSVSHDLRSPLVNLQGFSQELANVCNDLRVLLRETGVPPTVRDRVMRLLDGNAAESVSYIQTAVARLSAIIDALLRLSRAGRVEYRRQAVDVAAAVRRVIHALQNSIRQCGAQIVVHELPPAWGDPTALEQVFANLIGNAVNYLDPHRHGKIEVGVVPGPVEGCPPGQTVYYIKDNGTGIPGTALDKVFLAFQRLRPEAAAGEGIGLTLVRRVVERHGGKIWLTSTVDVGTTFFVTLPPPAN